MGSAIKFETGLKGILIRKGKSRVSTLVGGSYGSRPRPDELIQFFNKGIHFHAVHQCPVFQGIEIDCKATSTTHFQVFKELHRLGICNDNLIDSGTFAYNHDEMTQIKQTCSSLKPMLASNLF